MFSMGTQGVALLVLAWVGVIHPEVLVPPTHDYHFIQLVSTPPPVNHEPAPVRLIKPAVLAHMETPSPNALRLAPEKPKAKPDDPPSAPRIEVAAKPVELPPTAPVIPRELVKTNVFSTGSSAPPTIARAPQQVQTGGFGDPNGVPARENRGKPVTIAQLGSYDLPSGPGYGNGTGGAKGTRGVVASAGFGSGIATGDGSGRVSTSRGTVRQSGFGDTEPVAANQVRSKPAEAATAKVLPAEIVSKPTPAYTEEARKLHVEGEVLLEVVFESSGKLRVVRIVRGLGHGLDEAAVQAAQQIRFKPAMRDGQPADSTAVLHIVFQLA
ncbi:MAG: TonB family protein [Acidobacteriia bacterium]|nr:TonB family protein [Terriglobia bacterium]